MASSPECLLTGLDWQQAAEFQPRFTDGTHFFPASEPDAYSWFLTYVCYDAPMDAAMRELGTVRPFHLVRVVRVKDDASVGLFPGFRS